MTMTTEYAKTAPERSEIDAMTAPTVVEFGTDWCGFCRAAQPLIAQAFQAHRGVHHIKIEDGSGRPLGRSFRVKLWPTLIFMLEGKEVARLVRPGDVGEIRDALALIDEPLAE
ncbi:thioredoxin family protein [Caballeronia sp. LZ062]|jgi:thioredoxin 1|uniref:thioredoxin family protein n=1 Tax=unclassified Caballeronia TaxID=2646786 RepID=UPI0020292B29|nr:MULTISPECIES: thioredoxin family protein [unclassified Caballeronia]MDR5857009.1 thioredoxin family protein [Caballeronia sp. LZ050]MDR5869594.1 thioredoxin family protein [Caballeronia sp. LZ062]